jgi:spore germination protein PC
MIYDHGLQKMLEYMQRQMQWQSETLVRLERLLESLDQQCGKMAKLLEELRGKPPLTVEYHFDQLKVEKLEGTLNIGLSPAGEQLEQWVVNGETPGAAAPEAQEGLETAEDGQEQDDGGEPLSMPAERSREFLYAAVRDEVYRYIDERGPKEMDRLEQQYGCITGTELRKFVLSDIRSQVDGRIQYYLAQAVDAERSTPEDIRRQTAAKVIRDINTALENYYRKFGEEKEA